MGHQPLTRYKRITTMYNPSRTKTVDVLTPVEAILPKTPQEQLVDTITKLALLLVVLRFFGMI